MGVMWERVAERRAGIVVTPDGRVFSESLLLRTLRHIGEQIFNNATSRAKWLYYKGLHLEVNATEDE